MYQKLNRVEQILFDAGALFMLLLYVFSAVIMPMATQCHRGIYTLVTYVLVFLLYRSKSNWMRIVDYLLMLASMVCIGYWIMNFEVIIYRIGGETDLEMAIAMVGILIGIELARRVVGNVFVIFGILMLLQGVYGYLAPDLISHAGATFSELCTSIFYKSDGVFGIMANVLATYVLLFVLFGAFLEKCGAQRFFIDFPLAAVGHKTGGPAKVSVIASGLFGSISGSAIANTVSTGAFNIPMMKKAGFKPHITGGIEPAASIGGIFMPPIMGAGGFIMAELTGVPYSKIMLVALFPALMYFFSVFMMVHYYAKKEKIVGERYPKTAWEIVRSEWIYTMPLVVIIALMLSGFSPGYSAVIGLATCVAVSFKEPHTRIDPTLAFIMGCFILALVMTFLAESAEQYTYIFNGIPDATEKLVQRLDSLHRWTGSDCGVLVLSKTRLWNRPQRTEHVSGRSPGRNGKQSENWSNRWSDRYYHRSPHLQRIGPHLCGNCYRTCRGVAGADHSADCPGLSGFGDGGSGDSCLSDHFSRRGPGIDPSLCE